MRRSALKPLAFALAASAIALVASSSDALAGPIWVFSTSTGVQPTNVGTITLTQVSANSVNVFVDLINTALPQPLSQDGYGFLNTGGPHTPFAFQLSGDPNNLTVVFNTPTGGSNGLLGNFSLNTAGGSNTSFGSFNTAIDYSGGNGSSSAYYGDLDFTLTRTSGTLSTDDFIKNGNGYVFSADLTNGKDTGAQGWAEGIDPPAKVPEPFTMSLFGAGLAGMAALRRRKSNSGAVAA